MREPDTTTTTAANAMGAAEVDAFLAQPHVARLATVRPDGFPHVTPIWFVWTGDVARFILGRDRRHVRNLRRDPRAGLCVDADYRVGSSFAAGAQAVVIRGEVKFVDDADLLRETYAAQATKFLGPAWPDDADYIAGRDAEQRLLCVLRPAGVVSWDFRKASA